MLSGKWLVVDIYKASLPNKMVRVSSTKLKAREDAGAAPSLLFTGKSAHMIITQHENLIYAVRRALDIACPLSKSRPRGKPKLKFQYDPEVNTLKEDFLKCLYRYELTGSELDKDTMKQKKKTYDLKLRELRRAAANEHIASSDNKSKALWSIISGEKQKKSLMTHLDS
ncbi:hypothetical protein J6590_075313 [Homalodisca vitripennis]|nr:hypothetical protein J6590_075313 [Homalodisca vitripennis]